MCYCQSTLYHPASYLILIALLTLPVIGNAEKHEYKVVYANVPGIEEARVGNHDAAIEILESRARDADNFYVVNELATLCALYVVRGRLSAASVTCRDAVETDGSHAAYNNRGVFRAHLGDTAGALQDFKRARVLPGNLQHYIEERMQSDARLIANRNYAVVSKYTRGKLGNTGQSLAQRVHGASIEDINY